MYKMVCQSVFDLYVTGYWTAGMTKLSANRILQWKTWPFYINYVPLPFFTLSLFCLLRFTHIHVCASEFKSLNFIYWYVLSFRSSTYQFDFYAVAIRFSTIKWYFMRCRFFSCVVIALKSLFIIKQSFRYAFVQLTRNTVFFHTQIMQTIDKNNVNIELFVINATESTRHTRFDFFIQFNCKSELRARLPTKIT